MADTPTTSASLSSTIESDSSVDTSIASSSSRPLLIRSLSEDPRVEDQQIKVRVLRVERLVHRLSQQVIGVKESLSSSSATVEGLSPRVTALENTVFELTTETAKFSFLSSQLGALQGVVSEHNISIENLHSAVSDLDRIFQDNISEFERATLSPQILQLKKDLDNINLIVKQLRNMSKKDEPIVHHSDPMPHRKHEVRRPTDDVFYPGTSRTDDPPVAFDGLYSPWTEAAQDLVGDDYVEYSVLVSTLKVLRKLNFSVKANRDEAIKLLDNMPICQTVATAEWRFPDQLLLVNITVGICADLLQKLRSAYDAGERYLADTSTDRKMGSLDDAKLTTVKIATRIIELKRQHPETRLYIFGIYNRESFESLTRVNWIHKT